MGILLIAGFVIATGLWIWMAWANRGGRSWARIMATVLFGILTAGGLTWLVLLPTGVILFGSSWRNGLAFFLAYWLPGLGTVILLWQQSSSAYYTTANAPRSGDASS